MGLLWSILLLLGIILLVGFSRFKDELKTNKEETTNSLSRVLGRNKYIVEVEDKKTNETFLINHNYVIVDPLESQQIKGSKIAKKHIIASENVSPDFLFKIIKDANFPLYLVKYQQEEVQMLLDQYDKLFN